MSCGGASGGRAKGGGVRRALAVLACAAAMGSATAALAQHGLTGEVDLDRLIGMLDSPRYAVRQEATTALKIDERYTLARLEEALRRPDLTPEQRQRLLDVHWTRFSRTPRAAMGVQFDFVLPQRVVIDRLHDPFPAAKVLEPGDMIVSAAGVRLHGLEASSTMRSVILSHDPGDEVEVVVRRGAKKLTMMVKLGGWADFEGGARGSPSESDIRAAWTVRIARMASPEGAGDEGPIDIGVTSEQWAEMENAARTRRTNRQAALLRSGAGGTPARLLLAGGQPRNDLPDEIERERLELEGKNELNVIQLRRAQQLAEVRPRGTPETPEQEVKRLRQHADRLRQEVAELRQRQLRDELDPRYLAEFEREVIIVEKLVEAVRADAAEQ